ncbi:NUDIX hydrolase [Desulfohalobium retbaense]|uniref:NUDIX hydrolase n=1 Tax=Desulfohalobium retbaense (strain ATCC 49708 / DSM 5692 / JCM 16813 / HR100) TaxID=485915 RepID=C8X4P1_DESRD|nr:NUDIX hydrolase [Desulfohalobium retbaense]ACV69264.1 NUDIX hydrolase [Desulfohalobium retbaense DSM 5692]
MSETETPAWLRWAREIQAISQIGLYYSKNQYDEINFSRLMEIAAEMAAAHSDLDQTTAMTVFGSQPGYATVKVDVRGALVRDSQLLLVKERRDGRWCMPGGWADVGETPSEMVSREVLEESGFTVVPERIVGVYDANRAGRPLSFFHAYKILFLCRITGGTARPSEETEAVEFFDFDTLPPLSSPRTSMRHIEDLQRCLQNPDQPTVFD